VLERMANDVIAHKREMFDAIDRVMDRFKATKDDDGARLNTRERVRKRVCICACACACACACTRVSMFDCVYTHAHTQHI